MTACGSGGSESTASSRATTSSTSAGCTTDSTVNAPAVSLLPIPPAAVTVDDPGVEPRVVTAASADNTSPQRVVLRTSSTSTSAGPGRPAENRDQSVELGLTARFLCTDPTDVELALDSATSPEPGLASSLRKVVGSRAGLAVASGSVPGALRLLPAAEADDAARSAVEQSLLQALTQSVTLPTVPIGVGARWRAVRTVSGGATVTQTLTATLRARSGNRLTVDVAIDEEPVNSVFVVPGTDTTLTIAAYSSSGTGTVTLDLSRGLPVDGGLTVSGGRSLVGADPNAPLLQRTSFSARWQSR
ncbi:hypothetical protein KIK15_00480 [Williamsia sp. CHRR-6]|nr:hypothetical protein [Williamsia sp. CHRR-6]